MTKFSAFTILILTIFLLSCENDTSQLNSDMPVDEQVNLLIEQNDYETALNILSAEDQEDPRIVQLREKTHLNYALHSMNTFDAQEMRTRMNNALAQFTEVLKINPQNTMAREQIEQIMGIYATMPDRSADEEVIEGLREVGFDY